MYTLTVHIHFHLLTHEHFLSVHYNTYLVYTNNMGKKGAKQIITIECHFFCALLYNTWCENGDGL